MTDTASPRPFTAADPIDVIALEIEARRLRAEAAAGLFRSLGRWIAARLSAGRRGVVHGA